MFLSTRLWWRGEWPGYKHPLRVAWRKNHGRDPWWNLFTSFCFAFLVFACFGFVSIVVAIHDWPKDILGKFIFFGSPVILGCVAFTSILRGGDTTFTKTLDTLARLFQISITKDFLEYELRRRADERLCELAGQVIRCESAIAKYPHNDELYKERERTRSYFAEKHQLFLWVGLVEPTWDSYFQRYR